MDRQRQHFGPGWHRRGWVNGWRDDASIETPVLPGAVRDQIALQGSSLPALEAGRVADIASFRNLADSVDRFSRKLS